MTTDTETLTPSEAADKARRYKALKEVESQVKAELEPLADDLRKYIERTGEPLVVEGQPDLMLKPRRTATKYDVKAFAANQPLEFERALEMGGLTLNKKVMDALVETGQLTKVFEQYGDSGETLALVWGKQR